MVGPKALGYSGQRVTLDVCGPALFLHDESRGVDDFIVSFNRTSSVVLVVVLGLAGVACGTPATVTASQTSDSPVSTEKTTISSVTTAASSVTTAASTGTTAASTVTTVTLLGPDPLDLSDLDTVLVDRSLLSLGLRPTDPRSGRFLFRPGYVLDYVPTVEGRYWVTGSGNVYTALDVDPQLIADETVRLVTQLFASAPPAI